MELKAPVVSIYVENLESQDTEISLECSVIAEAASQKVNLPSYRLAAFKKGSIPVPLPIKALQLDRLQFSGKIQVEVVSTTDGGRRAGSATLPPLYYHTQHGRILVYREKVMRERFAAGNLWNVEFPLREALGQLRQVLRQAEVPNVEPMVARVSRTTAFAAGPNPQGAPEDNIRFCLYMPGEAFYDSSDRVWLNSSGIPISRDYGEDYGRAGMPIPMSRAWVALHQNSDILFSGMLDQYGCTPSLPAKPNAETGIMFSPFYFDASTGIRGFVSDLNLGGWPDFEFDQQSYAMVPLFIWYFYSADSPLNMVSTDPSEPTQTMYAAASRGMERARFGQTNVLYEWRRGLVDDNTGTAANYAPEGHVRIHVKDSSTVRSKFTLVHEYGHAVLLAKLNPALDDIDYSTEMCEPESNHTLDSKEWQLVAAMEGFANFTAAITWNEAVPFESPTAPCCINQYEGAVYVGSANVNPAQNTSDIIDMDQFDQVFKSGEWLDGCGTNGEKDPEQYPGQGVEIDWAQFFWNYYTDDPEGGIVPPTQAVIHEIWMQAYSDQNWPKHEGFFTDFYQAASIVLNPLNLWRFMGSASQAGIN